MLVERLGVSHDVDRSGYIFGSFLPICFIPFWGNNSYLRYEERWIVRVALCCCCGIRELQKIFQATEVAF